jgi:hypothetical protein
MEWIESSFFLLMGFRKDSGRIIVGFHNFAQDRPIVNAQNGSADRLDRAHSDLGNAQLCGARDGEHADLQRAWKSIQSS